MVSNLPKVADIQAKSSAPNRVVGIDELGALRSLPPRLHNKGWLAAEKIKKGLHQIWLAGYTLVIVSDPATDVELDAISYPRRRLWPGWHLGRL
jgi:hypothetical protein